MPPLITLYFNLPFYCKVCATAAGDMQVENDAVGSVSGISLISSSLSCDPLAILLPQQPRHFHDVERRLRVKIPDDLLKKTTKYPSFCQSKYGNWPGPDSPSLSSTSVEVSR